MSTDDTAGFIVVTALSNALAFCRTLPDVTCNPDVLALVIDMEAFLDRNADDLGARPENLLERLGALRMGRSNAKTDARSGAEWFFWAFAKFPDRAGFASVTDMENTVATKFGVNPRTVRRWHGLWEKAHP
ncbi:hypothetical protein D769_04369 [Cupriavidus sp. HMR-1]|uniref:hypothetical protein n=1 Tax=Cupriavidus sp. HMR-1 TaxID=1249621 RepID=UPI0002A36A9A|nr:hypothetical protein [Cupriavidus sp. HMR-1]ELA00634.1 hypothetical protein D769_04369 [Cupriavidus sp. HMR-1]